MTTRLAAVVVAVTVAGAAARTQGTAAFDSSRAFEHMRQLVAIGPRPSGSAAIQQARGYIEAQLKAAGLTPQEQAFEAQTPFGVVRMANVIARIPGARPERILITGHFDTKLFRQFRFVGANDGGSSTGIVLAFADALKGQKTRMQVWLMWTDLEEAIESFQGDDGLYGSRHFAQKLKADGLVPRIRGFFLLDMIGDTDLNVSQEQESSPVLQAMIAKAADELGYTKYFFQSRSDIIDDHISFKNVGIPSVDVVDAEFGRMGPQFDGMGEFHHANTDTIDKVSQKSLEIVGRTILRTVELMDAK